MNFHNKNILLILHTGALGGAERQGLGISKILTEKYHCNVKVLLTYSDVTTQEFQDYAKECYVTEFLHFGYPHLVWKRELSLANLKRLKWSFQYLFKLKKELQPYSFDIIIPFLNFPSKIAYYLYKMLPSVKFTFWHQLGLDVFTHDIFEYIAAKNIPCVIANASNGIEIYQENYKIDPQKNNVLPQYISMVHKQGDKKSLRDQFGIPRNAIVIGMIAHYRPEKLNELLLNSFDRLNKEFNDLYLVFLGNKNNTTATLQKFNFLNKMIVEKGLSENVLLLSDIKVEKILNILDIGVLVSEIEGMPNVVMEYMLYGLPVVATKHPGCEELLKNPQFLIENTQEQLYSSLKKLVLSKKEREAEGKRNAHKIKEYTMENYIEKLEVIMNKYIV